jgi:hypothetical protein
MCATDGDCATPSEFCVAGFCYDHDGLPPQSCESDADCGCADREDCRQVCSEGLCRPGAVWYECFVDAQCSVQAYCAATYCVPRYELEPCLFDADCPEGQICQRGGSRNACVDPPGCHFDAQCPPEHFCEIRTGRCQNLGGECATLRSQDSSDLFCDDDDPCTLDSCDPATDCVHTPIPGCE